MSAEQVWPGRLEGMKVRMANGQENSRSARRQGRVCVVSGLTGASLVLSFFFFFFPSVLIKYPFMENSESVVEDAGAVSISESSVM